MKTYLERLLVQAEELRAKIETIETRAVDEDRDVTDEERAQVDEHDAAYRALAEQIKTRKERQDREAAVAQNAPKADEGKTENRGPAQTQDRDPGHYRSTEDGGTRSFFGDLYRSGMGDWNARQRLDEHTRALSAVGSHDTNVGTGSIPPKYLADQYLAISRAGRVVADMVTPLSLGDDPRAITLPEQTAGTDAVVAAQANENTAPASTDAYATAGRTLTPAPLTGEQKVSRQLLDSASPAIDQLIFNDLNAVYDEQAEKLVVAAIVAAATAQATYANEAAFYAAADPAGPTAAVLAGLDGFVDAQTGVWTARKRAATLQVVSAHRWGVLRKMRDDNGHPIIPPAQYNTVNVVGRQGGSAATPNGMVADFEALPLFVSHALDVTAGSAESSLVFLGSDVILAEGNTLQFRFEEVSGPHTVVLGIWKYAGALVRMNGTGARKLVVTSSG